MHHYRNVTTFRLAEQQVDVLRHHDIADNYKTVTTTDFFKHLQEQIPVPGTPQQRLPLIATGRNEVHVAGAVTAVESSGHKPALALGDQTCL